MRQRQADTNRCRISYTSPLATPGHCLKGKKGRSGPTKVLEGTSGLGLYALLTLTARRYESRWARGPVGGIHGAEQHPPIPHMSSQPVACMLQLVHPACRSASVCSKTSPPNTEGGRSRGSSWVKSPTKVRFFRASRRRRLARLETGNRCRARRAQGGSPLAGLWRSQTIERRRV